MSSASLECAGAGGCMGVRNSSSSSHVSGPPLGYRGSSGALEGKRCSLGLGGWDFSSLAAAMKSGRPLNPNVRALTTRIEVWGPRYYNCSKEPPT